MIKQFLAVCEGWAASQIYFKISFLNDFFTPLDLQFSWKKSPQQYVVQSPIFLRNVYGYYGYICLLLTWNFPVI